MRKDGDLAEVRFERFLREHRYGFEYQPDLGNGKRPDYLVRASQCEFVCEVKSFNTDAAFGPTLAESVQVGARSQKEILKPIRKHISEAARQLKGISGRPLVVVLANPRGCPVPLDSFSVMAAMYGDVLVEFCANAEVDSGDATWVAGYNRKLAVMDPDTGVRVGGDHEYISAIVVLRQVDLAFEEWSRRWWDEHDLASFPEVTKATAAFAMAAAGEGVPHSADVLLDVFETLSDQAVPLPRDVFNGPHDRRWVPDDTRTALVPL